MILEKEKCLTILTKRNQRNSVNGKANTTAGKSLEEPQKAKDFYNSGGKKIEQLKLNLESSTDGKTFKRNSNEKPMKSL